MAGGEFSQRNLQAVLWLQKKKKKKKLEATPRLMGVRWKRGFCSSCFHHPSASGCWERGRVIAAGVNLPDLFSLTAASLTINLNLPRREKFAHICVLAGGGKNGVVMQCNPRALLKEWWSWVNRYYSAAADMDMTDNTIICSLEVSSLFTGLKRGSEQMNIMFYLIWFFSPRVVHIFSSGLTCDPTCVYLNSRFWGSCVKSICRGGV